MQSSILYRCLGALFPDAPQAISPDALAPHPWPWGDALGLMNLTDLTALLLFLIFPVTRKGELHSNIITRPCGRPAKSGR